jgi:hypothetical protein
MWTGKQTVAYTTLNRGKIKVAHLHRNLGVTGGERLNKREEPGRFWVQFIPLHMRVVGLRSCEPSLCAQNRGELFVEHRLSDQNRKGQS